jgi:hypothetical protein
MKQVVQYRQGDVFLERVASIPKGAKPVKRDAGRVVLAYGEVTGHAHAIADKHVTMLEVDEGIRYLDVLRVAPDLRPLPPGDWSNERKRDWMERQKPQAMTARNAVASLHGLRGEQYLPTVET